MEQTREIWRRYKPFVAAVLSIVSILQLVDIDWLRIIVSIQETAPLLILKNFGFFVLAIGLAYFSWVSFVHRNRPVTVVESEAELIYRDESGSNVLFNLKQQLRPNRSGVSAYHSFYAPKGSGGRVLEPRNDDWNITGEDYEPKSELHYTGDEYKGWDIIQRLHSSMPLRKTLLLQTKLISRSVHVRFADAFLKEEETFTYFFSRYDYKSFKFRLTIPASRSLIGKPLAYLIISHAMLPVTVHKDPTDGDKHTYIVSCRPPRRVDSTLRVQWTFGAEQAQS